MKLSNKIDAWIDLFRRYSDHFSHYWNKRKSLSEVNLKEWEAEFLPAALSIQEKPVSPTARIIAFIVSLIIIFLIIWSIFGNLDVVVPAQGKIISLHRIKSIASLESASVRAIHVYEGKSVKSGDLLVELNSESVDSDSLKAQADIEYAKIQHYISKELLSSLKSDLNLPIEALNLYNLNSIADQNFKTYWIDFINKYKRLQDEIYFNERLLTVATERALDYKKLALSEDVSRHAYMEKEQQRIELEGRLLNSKNQLMSLISETRKYAQDNFNESQKKLNDSTLENVKARSRSSLMKLTSPVDGTVQQLTIFTIGGIVSSAQTLMQIVPDTDVIEIEAFIENKDIGFVSNDQDVSIKIDAFDYTKYGIISGKVTHVSRDAIQDEKKGLIYMVKILINNKSIFIDGKNIKLSPGLSVKIEIKTGFRSVIQYFLSPIIKHIKESLNER
jgi:hemolysin D